MKKYLKLKSKVRGNILSQWINAEWVNAEWMSTYVTLIVKRLKLSFIKVNGCLPSHQWVNAEWVNAEWMCMNYNGAYRKKVKISDKKLRLRLLN